MANVADDEDTRHAGLEEERIAIQSPAPWQLTIFDEIGAGEDETQLIAINDSREPVSARQRADEDEERVGRHTLDLAGIRAEHGDLFEACFAMYFVDAGVSPDRYVGNLLDLVDQILRHGAGQRIAAHQHNDFFRVLREVDCGLSGGVGATNNIEGLAFTGERVGGSAAVVNACPLQAVDAGDVEAPP